MSYSNASAFPKGRFRTTNLSDTAQAVFTGGRHINGFRIIGGAAAEVVIFRASDDSPVYFQVPVAAGVYIESDIQFYAEDGLEVHTSTTAGDVEVVIHYTGSS